MTPLFFQLRCQSHRFESMSPFFTGVVGSISAPHLSHTALIVYSIAIGS